MDFTKHSDVLTGVKAAQDADSDIRSFVREGHHFVNKRDGQWEPDILTNFIEAGKPRYTFDKTGPVVDQIAGEMNNADFTLKIRPAGGAATKDTAKTIDGLIRNIRNISNADDVFNAAGRSMVTGGMDGWEVVQDFIDGDSFDQDLFIRKIHNWVDRVWFDPASEDQDHSDAEWVVVLDTILTTRFMDEFPDKTASSVGDGRDNTVYTQKPDFVTVGRILYKKPQDITIVRMNNGKVYQMDDDYDLVKDELAAQGIVPELNADGEPKTRKRKSHRVYSRMFSGDDWLTDEEETVFDHLPVCATYGNFSISENKRIVRGIVEKMMDEQRVLNYAGSEEVRQTALAPIEKVIMTKQQAAGHHTSLSTMNTNNEPVQLYTHVEGEPPPYKMQGAMPNMGLQAIMQRVNADLNATAGMFASNMGDNPGLQSGIAIDRQISKGDNSTTKWFQSQKIAICYTGKVIVSGALGRVYDSTRQVRILGEDGSFDMDVLNQTIIDEQTGQTVTLNDLSVGEYDVVCDIGLAFASKQRETVAAFAEMAAIDPSIMLEGKDVWLGNQDAPGMEVMAERARYSMVINGQIPPDQLTDEEQEMLQQMQEQQAGQEQQPDPASVIAQAEMVKADAQMKNAENDAMELSLKAETIRQQGEASLNKMENDDIETELKVVDSNTAAIKKGTESLNELIESSQGMPMTRELQNAINQQVREIQEDQAAMGGEVANFAYDELSGELNAVS